MKGSDVHVVIGRMTDNFAMKRKADLFVTRIVGDEWVQAWWNSYNLAFGMTPNDMWPHDPDRVIDYLELQVGDYL